MTACTMRQSGYMLYRALKQCWIFTGELDPNLTKALRFRSSPASQIKPLRFLSDDRLDGQTTRNVRRLTLDSAELLDRIIRISDKAGPSSPIVRRITEEWLA